jgi:hypothetical protein
MPRPLRAFGEGIFHLTAHASDIRYLFLNDEDREDFLRRLAAVCKRLEPGLLCYVLMGNHYHVIVRIPDTRISHALRYWTPRSAAEPALPVPSLPRPRGGNVATLLGAPRSEAALLPR